MSYRLDTNIQSSTLYLDSTNCVSRSPIFKYALATPITCPTSSRMLLSVQSISLPNVINNITAFNNKLAIETHNVISYFYNIVIPVGIYSAWSFRDYINAYFTALAVDVVCVYNVQSFRFSFVSGHPVRITNTLGYETTCGAIIGVSKNESNEFVYPLIAGLPYYTLEMPSTVNFSPTPFIFLKMNNITLSNINSRGVINNSLVRFPVNCQFGEMIQYRPTELNRFIIQRTDMNAVEIYFEDSNNNPLSIPGGVETQVIMKIDYIFPQPDSVAYDAGTIPHYFRENPIQEQPEEDQQGLGEL